MPDLAVVTELRAETVSANERMGKSPDFSFELAESLSEPAGESKIVKALKGAAILLPKQVKRGVRIKSHRAENGATVEDCRVRCDRVPISGCG